MSRHWAPSLATMAGRQDSVDEVLEQWAAERPDLDARPLGPVLRIHLLDGLLAGRLDAALAPHGLARWEFDVLAALRRVGPPHSLSPGALCASAQLSSGAMTHRIDRLQAAGLVRRGRDPADRRGVQVALTRKGLALADRAIGARLAVASEVLSGLSAARRRALDDGLRELILGFEEGSTPSEPRRPR